LDKAAQDGLGNAQKSLLYVELNALNEVFWTFVGHEQIFGMLIPDHQNSVFLIVISYCHSHLLKGIFISLGIIRIDGRENRRDRGKK
jgi:hypothetical protein